MVERFSGKETRPPPTCAAQVSGLGQLHSIHGHLANHIR
jgi:hypothetical protein